MAYSDLTANEQAQVRDFLRNYRAAMADAVRGLRAQQLLLQSYTDSVAPLWDRIGNDEVVDDGSGLAGADLSMTKAEFAPMFAWTTTLLGAAYSVAGGQKTTTWPTREQVDSYGVKLAGPGNIG